MERERDYDIQEREQVLATPYSQARPDIIKWQLDPSDILKELEYKLRGIIWDEELGKFIQARKPLANNEGINILMTIIESRINKILILSNLDEFDVKAIVIDCISNVIDLLFMRYEELGIKKEHLSNVRGIIDDTIYVTLRRALNQGEREFLKTTEKRIESYVDRSAPQQQKKSLFNLFKL